jgi:hypothetical protein
MVMPCNLSIAALEGFLINSRYCREATGALDKQSFTTAGERRSFWNAFFLARPQSQLTEKKAPKNFTKPATKEKTAFVDICFHWNHGMCSRASEACTSRLGTTLHHVCDQKIDRDDPSKRCKGEHQRCTFHK